MGQREGDELLKNTPMIPDINEYTERLNREVRSMPNVVEPLDDLFYIFAIRVGTVDGEIRRMLEKDKLYYLLKGFIVCEDKVSVDGSRFNRPVYDFYMGAKSSVSHVSVSAIVGENGSGKSSLIEFEIRLINNFAAALFGEYSKEPGWEHLHYVNGVNGELFFMSDYTVYKLIVEERHVGLKAYRKARKQVDGGWVFSLFDDDAEILVDVNTKNNETPFDNKKINQKEAVKSILSQFFYTIVLNQSVYAYNTLDFKKECNSEEYEVKVRKCHKRDKEKNIIPYSTEDRCWLKGLFHKNDGYQIPIVLSPYRVEGNFDINTENELAYERLISLLVHSGENFKIINGHLRFNCFVLKKKNSRYNISYIHEELGYKQFGEKEFKSMKSALIDTWITALELNDVPLRNGIHTALAKNYLVYKTLKIVSTYDEYDDYRKKYLIESSPYDEVDFVELVKRTITNRSHVTKKLYRTFAFLIWNVFDVGGGVQFRVRVDDVAKRWAESKPGKVLNKQVGTANLILQSVIPPPFFEMSIELLELNTLEVVPLETLSSGEKQQAYTISSLLYHIDNLDSVGNDMCTEDRVEYQRVHLVLEEVELYFHPQLQKEFVRNLLDGLRQMNFSTVKWIDIRVVTHSPFVLSDIPNENVLTLRKRRQDIDKIDCFGANIHEMLRNTFFLSNGTIGDFATWLIKRVAQCLRVHRWQSGAEIPLTFFPSLKGEIPDDFNFIENFKQLLDGSAFNYDAFNEVYGKEKLLQIINMVEEPVVKRVLLDDYRRTFPKDEEGYRNSLRQMIQKLQNQLDEIEK